MDEVVSGGQGAGSVEQGDREQFLSGEIKGIRDLTTMGTEKAQ